MMRRNILALIALCAAALPACAQDLASMQRAQELGMIIASEDICDLALDQTGIEAWIAANVPEGDMSFASNLSLMTQGAAFQLQGMSAAAKTAHCTAVRRTASAAGLIR